MFVHVVSTALVLLSCTVFGGIAAPSSQEGTTAPSVVTVSPRMRERTISVTNVTSTDALVKWNANGTVYIIRVWTGDNKTTGYYMEKFNTQLRIPNLQPWTEYRVQVSVQEKFANKSSFTVVGQTTFRTQCAAPSAPRQLEVVNVTSSSITLRWQPPKRYNGRLEGYTVFFHPKDKHQGGKSLATGSTSATVTSLTYGTEYLLSVKAYNKINSAELGSEEVQITVSTLITAPTKVRNLHLVSLGDGTAVVEWSPPQESNGPLDGYLVYWCLGVNGTFSGHFPGECRSQDLPGNATRASETELLHSTNYSVYVTAFNLKYENGSKPSKLLGDEAKIYVRTPGQHPQAVDGMMVHSVNRNTARISWKAVPDVDGYIVEWCQHGNCTEQDTNETEITITNVQSGTSYNVSVVGYRKESDGLEQTGPLRTMQVFFHASQNHAEPARHTKYVAGTIVCAFLVVLLAIAIVYVWRRPWLKPGPTPYKRMSSLEQDEDDILFMKTVPSKTI